MGASGMVKRQLTGGQALRACSQAITSRVRVSASRMSRIRTVKPELFKHEELFDTELASGLPLRLAFISLFTVADCEGRFKWRPRTLRGYPAQNLPIKRSPAF